MTLTLTRRGFLTTASASLTSGLILTPALRAQTPQALMGFQQPDPDALLVLAQKAMEAAQSAGASFADVRVLTGLRLTWLGGPMATASVEPSDRNAGGGQPYLFQVRRLGVRAFVDGHMGFAGNNLSMQSDDVAALARLAVERARAMAGTGIKGGELAAAPVISDGQYETPYQIDPFEVSFGEQEQDLITAMEAMRDTPVDTFASVGMGIRWKRLDELYLNTEGTKTSQRIFKGNHTGVMRARLAYDNTFEQLGHVVRGIQGTGGYELVADFPQVMHELVTEANSYTGSYTKEAEPGAYDVVFAPEATASLVRGTLAHPLEVDRALARAAGSKDFQTSYVGDANEALGTFEMGSDLLNIRADRTRAGLGATVGFDSEGIAAGETQLVKDGIVADYLTDRSFSPELAEGYARLGRDVASNGCLSDTGGRRPRIKLPNIAMEPGAEAVDVPEFIKDVKKGYYVQSLGVNADHSGLNVQGRGGIVREIRDGQLGDLVMNAALQFNTPRFWANLEGVGSTATLAHAYNEIDMPHYERMSFTSVTAPAIFVKNVPVTNSNRRRKGGGGGGRGSQNSEGGLQLQNTQENRKGGRSEGQF